MSRDLSNDLPLDDIADADADADATTDGEDVLQRADRPPVIAYACDRQTEVLLRDVLADAAPGTLVRRGGLAAARKTLAGEATPNVLILDVSGEPDPLSGLDELAQVVEPGVRVLVIGERTDMEFYRLVTRELGALEYLYKPLNRETVARSFVPLIQGRGLEITSRTGRLITVNGVRGGVGATLVAVNLAYHLAENARRHTLMLDADLHAGTAALALASQAQGGLRVALEAPERIDDLFIERAAVKISDRLHVLAGEERHEEQIHVRPEAVRKLTEAVQRRYRYVVADLPRYPSTLSVELGALSHQRVIVMEPTLPSLRDALRHLSAPRGPNQSRRPIIVLNKLGAPGTMPAKQILDALGMRPEVEIPWQPKRIGMAIALGEAAVRQNGKLQDAIGTLMREIIATRETATKPRRRFGLVRRMMRRS